MKTELRSRLLPASIGVTSAAILSILLYWFANIFFGKALNSSGYYALVIVLGAASAVLGMIQVFPRLSALRRTSSERQTNPVSLESDADSEQQAYDDLASDLLSALTKMPVKQRRAMSVLLNDLVEQDFQDRIERDISSKQQSYPIKVTMEIHGVPISIETPDVNKAEDIANLLMQLTQATSSPTVKQKAQQSVVRESEGTYRRVEDTGTFEPGAESEQTR